MADVVSNFVITIQSFEPRGSIQQPVIDNQSIHFYFIDKISQLILYFYTAKATV